MSEEVSNTEKQAPQQSREPREPRGDDRGPQRGMDDRDGGDRKRSQKPRFRKKVLDTRGLDLDYKNGEVMERFVSRTGKLLPRRMTGASARIQRKIAREVKRARQINLLPFSKR